MKIIDYRKAEAAEQLAEIFERTAFPDDIEAGVSDILKAIRTEGDAAVARYAETFDKTTLTPDLFRITADEIASAERTLTDRVKNAIKLACDNVMTFSEQRIPKDWSFIPS